MLAVALLSAGLARMSGDEQDGVQGTYGELHRKILVALGFSLGARRGAPHAVSHGSGQRPQDAVAKQ